MCDVGLDRRAGPPPQRGASLGHRAGPRSRRLPLPLRPARPRALGAALPAPRPARGRPGHPLRPVPHRVRAHRRHLHRDDRPRRRDALRRRLHRAGGGHRPGPRGRGRACAVRARVRLLRPPRRRGRRLRATTARTTSRPREQIYLSYVRELLRAGHGVPVLRDEGAARRHHRPPAGGQAPHRLLRHVGAVARRRAGGRGRPARRGRALRGALPRARPHRRDLAGALHRRDPRRAVPRGQPERRGDPQVVRPRARGCPPTTSRTRSTTTSCGSRS